jgi:predicted lipid-binding transport protein (Tim44 family)
MMLLGVALVRGVLVMLRVVWGAGRLSGFGGGGGFSRLGWFAWLGGLCGCGGFGWLSGFSRLGGFGGGSGLGRLGGLCGWFAWLLCRGCLSRLSRLFLGLRAEKRTQGQKGPNDYDTHTRYKSTQSRANASP